MSQKLERIITVAVLLAVGIWFYATPYLAAYRMEIALRNHDPQTLDGIVDYPVLKDNLRATVEEHLVGRMINDPLQARYTPEGAALAMAIALPMIDALVTPDSLAKLLRGEIPRSFPPQASASSSSPLFPSNPATVMSYESFNRFVITTPLQTGTGPSAGDDDALPAIHLVLSREGLWTWKLTDIRLPL